MCVSFLLGLISVARVNEWRTTGNMRVLKAPGAELCQNDCSVVNEIKAFCSHQCSPDCSMNKFRAYICIYMLFYFVGTCYFFSNRVIYITKGKKRN